jgi:ferredoxin-NADP reductase
MCGIDKLDFIINKSVHAMETQQVKITSISKVTHDVLQIRIGKPQGFHFESGQATEVSINKSGWENERRPFTFTCLPEDNFLEFTIKTYPERNGVTSQLLELKSGDDLFLHDVFGTILYQGEGTFIAGGAGVTPFISIIRHLRTKNVLGNNKLIFANKKRNDIILEEEFKSTLHGNFVNILSEEKSSDYSYGMITIEFLKKNVADINKKFYVCGPPPMMDAILKQLSELGVKENNIITEAF